MSEHSLKDTDIFILACLQQNARERLSEISRKLSLPITTIHNRVRKYEQKSMIKYSTLIDFKEIGYAFKAKVALKTEDKEQLQQFLQDHPNTNSVYRVENDQGHDLLIEMIFEDKAKFNKFLTMIETEFQIKDKLVFTIVEDIKREEFLCRYS